MFYKKEIIWEKLTSAVKQYIENGYFITLNSYNLTDCVYLKNKAGKAIRIEHEMFNNKVGYLEYPIYEVQIIVKNENDLSIVELIKTGIYYTQDSSRGLIYSDSIPEIINVAEKVAFRKIHSPLDVFYIGHIKRTPIKGFRKDVTVKKHCNGTNMQAIYINKNGRKIDAYYRTAYGSSIGYELERELLNSALTKK